MAEPLQQITDQEALSPYHPRNEPFIDMDHYATTSRIRMKDSKFSLAPMASTKSLARQVVSKFRNPFKSPTPGKEKSKDAVLRLQSENLDIAIKLEEQIDSNNDLMSIIDELNEQIGHFQSQKEDLVRENAEQRTRCNNLERDLVSAEEDNNLKFRTLEDGFAREKEEWRWKLVALNSELNALRASSQDVLRSFGLQVEENHKLELSNKDLQEGLVLAKERFESDRAGYEETYTRRIEELNETIRHLHSDKMEFSRQLDAAHQETRDTIEQSEAHARTAQTLASRIMDLQEEVQAKQFEHLRMEQQHKQSINRLESHSQSLEHKILDLYVEVEDLKHDVAVQEGELSKAYQELQDHLDTRTALDTRINRLKAQLKDKGDQEEKETESRDAAIKDLEAKLTLAEKALRESEIEKQSIEKGRERERRDREREWDRERARESDRESLKDSQIRDLTEQIRMLRVQIEARDNRRLGRLGPFGIVFELPSALVSSSRDRFGNHVS